MLIIINGKGISFFVWNKTLGTEDSGWSEDTVELSMPGYLPDSSFN